MKIYHLSFHQDFSVPAAKVFSQLSDHKRYGEITGAKIRRIREGRDPHFPNGEGSIRRIQIPLLPFEETVTRFHWPTLIEYKITKGSPLHHHFGRMLFRETSPHSCHLDYTIDVGSRIPLVGWIVSRALDLVMRQALHRFAQSIAS
jgi:hypothetical protein